MMTAASNKLLAAAFLAMMSIAGCKLTDDNSRTSLSGDGNTQNGGGTGGETLGSAPTIWGNPSTTVLVGASYTFRPEAEDMDGDVLEFAIENGPEWAEFNPATGTLQGVPTENAVGQHANIVISVSDAESVVALPSFSISVEKHSGPRPGSDDDEGTGGNGGGGSGSTPPIISGMPNTSVVVGDRYVFKPQVDDADGDELSFSIVNKPSWANFNTTTGRLGGRPKSKHLGDSKRIEISVTDGDHIVALARFKITVEPVGTASVTLSWDAPTQNADGTRLKDLAGYRIHYGTAPGEYSETIEIDSPGVTTYVIDDLAPGRYYLAMTSFNSRDMESDYTPEIEVNAGG